MSFLYHAETLFLLFSLAVAATQAPIPYVRPIIKEKGSYFTCSWTETSIPIFGSLFIFHGLFNILCPTFIFRIIYILPVRKSERLTKTSPSYCKKFLKKINMYHEVINSEHFSPFAFWRRFRRSCLTWIKTSLSRGPR